MFVLTAASNGKATLRLFTEIGKVNCFRFLSILVKPLNRDVSSIVRQ